MNINPVNFKLILALVVSILGVILSIINFILGKYITAKIMGNDLKHITADIDLLKKEETTYKKDLKQDLGKIFRRLGKIEREIVKRETICSLRHKNDK